MFFNNPEAFEKLAEETGLTEKIAHFAVMLNQLDKKASDGRTDRRDDLKSMDRVIGSPK